MSPMRLTQLDAELFRADPQPVPGAGWGHKPVEAVAEAHSVSLLCPKCYQENGGPAGTHGLHLFFADRGAPAPLLPKHGGWLVSGSSIEDLSFIGPGAASVLVMVGCRAHFFIRNGGIVDAD